jgi:hypothetical protein
VASSAVIAAAPFAPVAQWIEQRFPKSTGEERNAAHETTGKQAQNARNVALETVTETVTMPPSKALDILGGTLWDVSSASAASLRVGTVAALTTALMNARSDETILAVVAELRAWRDKGS